MFDTSNSEHMRTYGVGMQQFTFPPIQFNGVTDGLDSNQKGLHP